MHDVSPAARALLVLEMIQSSPGITADRLADRLGLSDRAVRRHVGVLREAGIPVESTRGRYGGYRLGRGMRLPPLMFTATEALGLVMAVLEGHPAGEDDPVGRALGKIVRALPEPLARPADAVRRVAARGWDVVVPDVEITAAVVQASDAGERVRLRYGYGPDREWDVELDPWAVVVRHRRWYLLGWSHDREARRVLRLDRVRAVQVLGETFEPPADLDPLAAVEEQLAMGWKHAVEVLIDAPVEECRHWLPRSFGRLEEVDEGHTRLVATTDEPQWYAATLANLPMTFRLVGSPEVRTAMSEIAHRLLAAAAG
ncbi:MAG TPA: WYL domain-containing protein [Nocardioides sp.]|nr:WYL domain-containing protein [Nocardioides sp.]